MSQTLAARLQNLKIDDDRTSAFVTKLTTSSLYSLWKEDNIEKAQILAIQQKDPSPKSMRRDVSAAINKAAVKNVLERFNHDELELLAKPAPIKHKQEYKKRVPANVLYKRLFEFMTDEEDLHSYFNKYFESDSVSMKRFMQVFEIEFEEDASAKDLVEQFVLSATLQGSYVYLSSMPVPLIQKVAINEKLTKTGAASKERLVDGILKGQLPEKRAAPELEEVSVKAIGRKRSIKNSDYWGMWQYYNLATLVEYCKENNIKTTGTKNEVINRILEWREADKENKKRFETKDSYKAAAETRSQKKKEEKDSKGKTDSKKESSKKESSKKESSKKESSKKNSQKDGKRKREVAIDSDDEEEQDMKVESKANTEAEESKKPSPPKKQKQDPVEPKESEQKSKKSVVEDKVDEDDSEPMEKEQVELQNLDEVDDDNAVDIIQHPELFTIETLKLLCEAQDVKIPAKCKTHAELVTLINNTVLDLENLEKYSLVSLKKFAKDQNIVVKGSTIADYVEAIKAQQEEDEDENAEEQSEEMES